MADSGEPSAGSKAIASLAKKPSDVTRQGTQKLKFVPTLPARRKKEETAKQEVPQLSTQPSDKGDGKTRGRGRGRGGEGRGSAPRPPTVEMTASGPFAMGPALAGTSARRTAPKSNFTPIVPQGPARGSATLGVTLAPTSRKDKERELSLVDAVQTPKNESDEEVYSEPDEGVEVIDMENIWQLDWMAPGTLQRERRDRAKRKGVKTENEELSLPSASRDQGPSSESIDPSNALDLSESDDEEELENLAGDFTVESAMPGEGLPQERIYFFQFPEPFPTFVSASVPTPTSDQNTTTPKRKVSFAADAKLPTSAMESATTTTQVSLEVPKETPKVDGVIGQVEVYRSGAVKMRLGNGIVLNVSEATRPSFLQQAVHLDIENKKLHVLGEVNKRFVVSPDLDALLTSMELADASSSVLDDAELIRMDTA